MLSGARSSRRRRSPSWLRSCSIAAKARWRQVQQLPHSTASTASSWLRRSIRQSFAAIDTAPRTPRTHSVQPRRDRRVTEELLHDRIAVLRSSGRYGIPNLLDVIEGCEVTRGGHSWLERRFMVLCADAGIPPPTPQVVLAEARNRIVRVDFEFPGSPVIEALGLAESPTGREPCASGVQLIVSRSADAEPSAGDTGGDAFD